MKAAYTAPQKKKKKSPNMAQSKLMIYFTSRLFFLSYKVDLHMNQNGLKVDVFMRKTN